jgi:hypothetical protein
MMVSYWFYRAYAGSMLRLATGLLPLGIPLMIGAFAFGWYNWARFGSISETGFSYALAGPNLRAHLDELFLPAYSFQNIYNYLLNPFRVKQLFPFFYPIRGAVEEILPWPALPEFYSAQAITGFLYAAPFTVFAVIPVIKLLKRPFNKNKEGLLNTNPNMAVFNWIMTSVLGAFLFSFLCLLMFFWAAMRYAEDFMPTLTLLSIIGFWQGVQAAFPNPNKGKMYTAAGLILAGLSIITGTLLALSIYSSGGLL